MCWKFVSIPTLGFVLFLNGCNTNQTSIAGDAEAIQTEIEKILKIQEDAYDLNSEEGRRKLAATCDDSLVFIGGDDGGMATSADFYVHDLADGYSQRPSNKTFRIFSNTVVVSAIQQSFKVFHHDTIYFNSRYTKIFVKDKNKWKMVFTTYAPLPVMYTRRASVKSDVLQDYAGLYHVSDSVADTISVVSGRLFMGTEESENAELIPINDSTFISKSYFGKTIFSRDKENNVTHNYYEFPDGQRLVFRKIK